MNKGPQRPGSKHWREQQAGDLVGALFPQDSTSNGFHTRLTGGQKHRACGEGHLWPLLIRSATSHPGKGARGWIARPQWPYKARKLQDRVRVSWPHRPAGGMTTALKQCPLTKKEDGVFIKPASDLPKEPEVTVWSLLTDSHLLSGTSMALAMILFTILK